MSDLILHHYAGSPFSEKLRLMLGFKGLPWVSVTVPLIMPKPDVVALTGGYRRTPFVQVGADIYCDTALVTRLLERLRPQPTVFPPDVPLAPLLAQWADSTLFWTVIPVAMQPAGAAAILGEGWQQAAKAFATDRAPFSAGMPRQTLADANVGLQHHLGALEAQLADGRPFLFGNAVSVADFSVAHCLWFLRLAGPVAAVLAPHAALQRWLDRIRGFGHGQSSAMSSGDAIAVAVAATGHATTSVQPGLGFEAGAPVLVSAIDYGRDPVAGTLVGLDRDEVVLRRIDERAGVVHVHFPRIGFQIRQEKA
jgi:glutathione S-transferase